MDHILSMNNINQTDIEKIVALSAASTWVIPNYIPELEQIVNPNESVLAVTDMSWTVIQSWNAKKVVSGQSVMKVLLYAFSLEKWIAWHEISMNEAVGLPFNKDPILSWTSDVAGHPLNNAWWIASAWFIDERENFLEFARICCNNHAIDLLESVYTSEKNNRENNLKISASLAASWRYWTNKIESALDIYTRASSLWVTTLDILEIGNLLMRWWVNNEGKRIMSYDTTVYVLNAMNTFWLYDESSRINLMIAGTKALAAKSWVSGLILRVNPLSNAYVTLGHHLDKSWNSVFGIQAAQILNTLLNKKNVMRLSNNDQEKFYTHYINDTIQYTKDTAIERIYKKTFCRDSFVLSEAQVKQMIEEIENEKNEVKKYINTCFIK